MSNLQTKISTKQLSKVFRSIEEIIALRRSRQTNHSQVIAWLLSEFQK